MKFFFTLFLLVFFLVASVKSQNKVYTYNELLNLAKDGNIEILKQKNNLKSVKLSRTVSALAFLPTIEFNGNIAETRGFQFSTQDFALVNSDITSSDLTFNTNIRLFEGFKKINELKISNSLFKFKKEEINQLDLEISVSVLRIFLQILLDKEQIQIANVNLKNQNDLFEQIQLLVNIGRLPGIELASQKAILKLAEANILRLSNKLLSDKASLSQVVQLTNVSDFDVRKPLWNIEDLLKKEYTIDSLFNTANNKRADIEMSRISVNANKNMLKSSRSNLSPKLDFFYVYGSSYLSTIKRPDLVSEELIEVSPKQQLLKENSFHSYGFSLNIPIFNGFGNRANIEFSKNNLENAKLELKNIKNQTYNTLQNLIQNFELEKSNYLASIEASNSANLAYDMQLEFFRLGLGDLVQLNFANQRKLEGDSQRIQSHYRLLFNKMIIDFNTGLLDHFFNDN